MDFSESLVLKFTTFSQSYRISSLVQLLCIRFHKMLHSTFQFLKLFCLIYPVYPLSVYPLPCFPPPLFTPFPVYPPPHLLRFPPCLQPHPPPPPPVFLPVYTPLLNKLTLLNLPPPPPSLNPPPHLLNFGSGEGCKKCGGR